MIGIKEDSLNIEENGNIGLNTVDSIFRQRERCIILGLTGRTGAGCSTVANILNKKTFDELDLRSYKTFDYNNSDERKYSIIYRFMKEGNKWIPFHVIEASTIIFSYIAENTFGDFSNFLEKIKNKGQIGEIASIKEKLYSSVNKITGKSDISCKDNEKIFPDLIDIEKFAENNSSLDENMLPTKVDLVILLFRRPTVTASLKRDALSVSAVYCPYP